MSTTTTTPRLIGLSQVAAITGTSLDVLRHAAGALASQGLLHRIGTAWVAESADVERIVAAARAVRRETRPDRRSRA